MSGIGATNGTYGTDVFNSVNADTNTPTSSTLKGNDIFTFKTTDSHNRTSTPTVNVAVDPATQFGFVAPSSAATGRPVTLTIRALDVSGNTATWYNGDVSFDNGDRHVLLSADANLTVTGYTATATITSSDTDANPPADMMLQNGGGKLSGTFNTTTNDTFTATDTSADTGNVTTTVTAPPP